MTAPAPGAQAARLYNRHGFEAFILDLAAVQIVRQWGDASVGKIGGKVFALYSDWSEKDQFQIAFKCSDISFQMLGQLNGVRPARYLARAKWVEVMASSQLGESDLRDYIVEAHRLVASKLTMRVKDELGLTAARFKKKP
ncbi:hypothetical protein MNBD_ALPHA12-1422 [hydrothermal vent metagenome]|uniref:MmcQ/YjbR family DNA-binding protein n=1 Tax=hydrothermal vent metagenome TaxID=652676 RepID=A0A3B0TSZ2_9ZZZZ